MESTLEIKVLNKNNSKLSDMFDGILYEFPTNEPVKIPQDAANHIFGVVFPDDLEACQSDAFRQTIFLHLCRRWGWNNYDPHKFGTAEKTFKNLMLTPVILQLVEKEQVEVDLAAPREQKEAVKGNKFKPRADENVDEEEVA
jgi:hypothetical protein